MHRVAVLNNILYVIGGVDVDGDQTALNSIERYDPQTKLWSSDVAPMSRGRCHVGVADINGFLYVTGGRDVWRDGDGEFHSETSSLVEKYDPKENTWTVVASMNFGRAEHTVVALDGCLYAIGGRNNLFNPESRLALDSVEKYDPRENRWTWVAPMNTKRTFFGGAVLKNKIYVAGGINNGEALKSAEVYNATTNTWSFIGNLRSERNGVSLAVVKEQMFAVGSTTSNSKGL